MTTRGLLLINLGSPASTSVADVKKYLNQFLMDPYVVDLPLPVRRLLVWMILLRRPPESARAYQAIWWPEGSPLLEISRQLCEKVRTAWPHGPVELGMRYGEPSIERALLALVAQGVKSIILAPLYPQFADSTTTTAVKEARRIIRQHQLDVELEILPAFYDDPRYMDCLLANTETGLQQEFDHLLLSFHGLPERHLTKLDPTGSHCLSTPDCCASASPDVLSTCYRAQCFKTAEQFAERAGLSPDQWSVSFQSRLGRAKWIEPYTEDHLDNLAARGVKKLLVMSPAFVADCIETLEELGIRGREQFIDAGGESLELLPCLNASDEWAETLVHLCEKLQ